MTDADIDNPIRALLVEDDEESGEAVQQMLERRGLSATRFFKAEEALAAFQPSTFDVAVVDIRLVGMNGVEFLRRIREKLPDFPVILLTGYDGTQSAIDAVRLGAQDYILKPLDDIETLLRPIRKAVHSHRLLLKSRSLEHELRQSEAQLRALAARLESVRESERTRIAREIHDELGHSLTALKMDLSWVARKIAQAGTIGQINPLTAKIEEMAECVDGTIQIVRRIATELRPGLLDHLGLCAAIEWQAQDFEKRTGIECRLAPDGDVHLDQDRSTGLFRVFQEILTNVARHAAATRVNVGIKANGTALALRVADNGRGITPKQIADPKSLGLLGMKERVRLLGGELSVQGESGQGTVVEARVPIPIADCGMRIAD